MTCDGRCNADGIWICRSANAARARQGLFLDRDGVLVEERHYLRDPADVVISPGAADLLIRARARGIASIVVTNQSGIARGLIDWPAFEAVQAEISRQLAIAGASVDLTLACPFHPGITPGYGPRHAHWRKPGPGLLLEGAARLGVACAASIMIGDKASDVAAAKAAGLPAAILVSTGHGLTERDGALALKDQDFDVFAAADLVAAAPWAMARLEAAG